MKKLLVYSVLGLGLLAASCNKDPYTPGTETGMTKDLKIPEGFEFKTTLDINLSVLVQNSAMVLSQVPVQLYLDNPGSGEMPNVTARLAGTFASGNDGRIDLQLRIPAYRDTVYLKTDYIGLESLVAVPVIGGSVVYHYGEGTSVLPQFIKFNPQANILKSSITYSYLGTYTSSGVPSYLVSPRDVITQDFLNDVNASLPEKIKLPVSHPEYLAAGNESDIVLKEQADVWITFVHEGASYLNSLGYYIYDVNNPPKKVKDISKYNVVFPNASYPGSGGGLVSGDKVFLGRFDAGKAIGWFLVPNGWSGGRVTGNKVLYSEPSFNVESDISKKQHTVLLYDSKRSVLLIAFEDMDRMNGSDDDFNDAIFYVTANPVSAVDVSRVPPLDTPADRDKDGITDTFDDYPDDKNLAFNYYYPAKDVFGTLVAEDLWPGLGDFDFNDLVVDYNFNQVADPNNQVVQMVIKLKTRAIGASFRNGFGIQLPVPARSVESVSGYDVPGDNVKLSGTGIESGQTNAVIIAFEDAYDVLPYVGSGTGVNVVAGSGWTEPVIQEIKVVFSTPQTIAAMGQAPYNPFLIVDGQRGKEIHMSGNQPTDLADLSFFGQSQDASDVKTGKYYTSTQGLPWMMDIPGSFDYMIEKKDILKGYTKFGAWAESGGLSYADWYLDLSGYRESSVIFKK